MEEQALSRYANEQEGMLVGSSECLLEFQSKYSFNNIDIIIERNMR